MLLNAEQSQLLVIDLQTKLAPAIDLSDEVERATIWMLQVAGLCQVPALATEHYPKGLGHSLPSILEWLPPDAVLEKIYFSAWREAHIQQRLAQSGRRQVVVVGTETHVCVLQTVMDLLAAGYQVFVVTDAVGSRTAENKQLGLNRMQQAGAVLVSREMVAFEWLERAGTELFRQISKGWIR